MLEEYIVTAMKKLEEKGITSRSVHNAFKWSRGKYEFAYDEIRRIIDFLYQELRPTVRYPIYSISQDGIWIDRQDFIISITRIRAVLILAETTFLSRISAK